jgi:MSHA type pilus biogenesis protein MshL
LLRVVLSLSKDEQRRGAARQAAVLLAIVVSPVLIQAQQAQPAAPLQPVPITQLDLRQPHPELDGQRISLGFSDATPIKDILLLLVRDTRLSVIPDPSLDQTFLGDLKNVTIREALDLILEPLGLDYSIRGEVIRVFPRELETRFYSIDYVITQRSGSRSIAGTTGASGSNLGLGGAGLQSSLVAGAAGAAGIGGVGAGAASGGSTSQVSGTDSPNLYTDLGEGVKALLSGDGRMNLDRTAALLHVTDRPSRLARVEQYLEAVMLRVTRQVQIEAKVIEVELRDEFSAGINWQAVLGGLTNNATATQTLAPATTGGFTLALNVGDFSALLNAFAAQGKVNVLSSPRITAMNNEPAVMRIGTQDVFFTTTTQIDSQSGQIVQSTVTPQSLTEGVVLSVTPQISADGIIHMNINPSITERTGVATSRLGDQVPIISVRETDTLVRVRQGETIVIAGLMQDRASIDTAKVPVIGDVPVVGHLFKRTEKSRRKTDLVILLTPTVMGPGETIATTAREIQRLEDARAVAKAR